MKHMELQKITRNGVFVLGLALVLSNKSICSND